MTAKEPVRPALFSGTVPPTAGLPLRAGDWLPGGGDFEAALARFIGVDAVLLACSGTAAFVATLEALKRRAPERDRVIVPAYTCPLMALAIAHCGLAIAVCEVLPASLDLDPAHLERLCDADTLAVVPTHLAGRVTDVGAACRIARTAGAWVIEDAAQALGARVGKGGDVGFFSLAVGKGLSIFEGGVLVARDPTLRAEIGARLAAQRGPWWRDLLWDARRTVELLGYWGLYRPSALGWAYRRPLRGALARRDWIVAAGDDFDFRIPLHPVGAWRRSVGARAIERLPRFLQVTAEQAERRLRRLAELPGVTVIRDSAAVVGAQGTWPVLLALMPSARARDALLDAHWGEGHGLGVPFVHALPDYARYAKVVPSMAAGEIPQARDLAARVISISNSPWLDDDRFERLLATISDVIEAEVLSPVRPAPSGGAG